MEYNIRVYKPELKQEEGKINNLKGFATITFACYCLGVQKRRCWKNIMQ